MDITKETIKQILANYIANALSPKTEQKEPKPITTDIESIWDRIPEPQPPETKLTYPEFLKHATNVAGYEAYGKAYPYVTIASALAPAILSAIGAYMSGKAGLGAGTGAGIGAQAGTVIPQTFLNVVGQQLAPYITQYQAQAQAEQQMAKFLQEQAMEQLKAELNKQIWQARREYDLKIWQARIKADELENVLANYVRMLNEEDRNKIALARLGLEKERLAFEMGREDNFDKIVRAYAQLTQAEALQTSALSYLKSMQYDVSKPEGRERLVKEISDNLKTIQSLKEAVRKKAILMSGLPPEEVDRLLEAGTMPINPTEILKEQPEQKPKTQKTTKQTTTAKKQQQTLPQPPILTQPFQQQPVGSSYMSVRYSGTKSAIPDSLTREILKAMGFEQK